MIRSEDVLLFQEQKEETALGIMVPPDNKEKWIVLIVDDKEEVHNIARMALRRFEFDGKSVECISAYSAVQGKQILAINRDIAVVLLNMAIEMEDAGLHLARYIRNEMNNSLVRIILHTGQPGHAPEYNVILEFDINDYIEKTELTTQKLHITLVTALRSYRDLSVIDNSRHNLKRILDSLASIFQMQSMSKFASGILSQMVAMLHLNPNALYCHASGFAATKKGLDSLDSLDSLDVLAATGLYESLLGGKLQSGLSLQVWEDITTALKKNQSLYFADRFVLYFSSKQGSKNILYLGGTADLSIWDRNLIEMFCANVSIAFDNIYLKEEMEETQKEILFSLGEIAEARSYDNGNHVKRVAEIAKLLALRYGLSEEDAEILRLTTPIHDVGKLAIPDAILNKPGKLTSEEFVVMKTHSPIGYEMLKRSKKAILRSGAIIALLHHERYDGTGYPQGLSGDEIHIYGRIVALADVFDALSNERVYKRKWPLEKVLRYIQEQRGSHFDPRLVDIFMENLDEILLICNKFSKL